MSHSELRDVLDRLSRGEITAEQADQDLAVLDAETAAAAVPHPPVGGPGLRSAPITVRATMNGSGPLTVLGEAVTVPEVRGPASANIGGGVAMFDISGSYAAGTELAVPADADLVLEVNGSEVELRGLTGTLDGTFNVGHILIHARLTRGDSRIHANAGPLVVTLAAGSDVRVVLRAACQWTVDPRITKLGAGEWVLGEGRALLDIEGNLGTLDLVGPAGE